MQKKKNEVTLTFVRNDTFLKNFSLNLSTQTDFKIIEEKRDKGKT